MTFRNHPIFRCVLLCFVLCIAASAILAQQEQTLATVSSANGVKSGNRDYRIGPGDVLSITVAGEPDLRGVKAKVSQEGTIELLYIEKSVKIAGLTEQQATELLRKEFTVILKEPQVTIFIEEYHAQMVSIAGAVNRPKQVALNREMRVYDLISDAGGLTDKAGNVIQLVRFQPTESMEIISLSDLIRKPELNRVLRDGDLINVPEAGIIYVTGNGVNKPGAFPLKEPIKLTAAIALAGGFAQDAKKKEVHLVRSNGTDQAAATETIINFAEIEKDASKDILLKPYDVVMIPESTRGKQTRSLIQAFAGGLSSALGWGIFR
jgi:polysaccharide export outer membrane protein